GVVERQLAHLLRRRLYELLAAIADIDAPEPGHAVEDGVALPVIDGRALGPRDDAAAAQAHDLGVVRLRRQMVSDVEPAQLGNVIVAGHRTLPLVLFCRKPRWLRRAVRGAARGQASGRTPGSAGFR